MASIPWPAARCAPAMVSATIASIRIARRLDWFIASVPERGQDDRCSCRYAIGDRPGFTSAERPRPDGRAPEDCRLGGVIVAFHNTWSGIPVLLTLVGWCLLIKRLIRFCAPNYALRMMARVSVERSWEFQAAGAALVVLAGLLGDAVRAG
jgi:hypothetical protein